MKIEDMARKACGGDSPVDDDGGVYLQPSEFQRFAALVRAQALDEAAMRVIVLGGDLDIAAAITEMKDRTEPA